VVTDQSVKIIVKHPEGRPDEVWLELLFLNPDGTSWQVTQRMARAQALEAAKDIKSLLGLA
jgi:hypothetical protein